MYTYIFINGMLWCKTFSLPLSNSPNIHACMYVYIERFMYI